MASSAAELLLHPVRLRIVQCFLGDRELTTAMLQAELTDVPPATLYRHVATLVDAGVLEVVHEQRVRGAVERTYALHATAAQVGPDEAAAMTAEEHRRAFTAFAASLLHDFDRYLERPDVDFVADGAGYRQYGLWLTDRELQALLDDLRAVLEDRLENRPARGRRRRLLSLVLFPAATGDEPGRG